MAVINNNLSSDSKSVVIIGTLGGLLCLVFALLGIKLKWFKHRMTFSEVPTYNASSRRSLSYANNDDSNEPIILKASFNMSADFDDNKTQVLNVASTSNTVKKTTNPAQYSAQLSTSTDSIDVDTSETFSYNIQQSTIIKTSVASTDAVVTKTKPSLETVFIKITPSTEIVKHKETKGVITPTEDEVCPETALEEINSTIKSTKTEKLTSGVLLTMTGHKKIAAPPTPTEKILTSSAESSTQSSDSVITTTPSTESVLKKIQPSTQTESTEAYTEPIHSNVTIPTFAPLDDKTFHADAIIAVEIPNTAIQSTNIETSASEVIFEKSQNNATESISTFDEINEKATFSSDQINEEMSLIIKKEPVMPPKNVETMFAASPTTLKTSLKKPNKISPLLSTKINTHTATITSTPDIFSNDHEPTSFLVIATSQVSFPQTSVSNNISTSTIAATSITAERSNSKMEETKTSIDKTENFSISQFSSPTVQQRVQFATEDVEPLYKTAILINQSTSKTPPTILKSPIVETTSSLYTVVPPAVSTKENHATINFAKEEILVIDDNIQSTLSDVQIATQSSFPKIEKPIDNKEIVIQNYNTTSSALLESSPNLAHDNATASSKAEVLQSTEDIIGSTTQPTDAHIIISMGGNAPDKPTKKIIQKRPLKNKAPPVPPMLAQMKEAPPLNPYNTNKSQSYSALVTSNEEPTELPILPQYPIPAMRKNKSTTNLSTFPQSTERPISAPVISSGSYEHIDTVISITPRKEGHFIKFNKRQTTDRSASAINAENIAHIDINKQLENNKSTDDDDVGELEIKLNTEVATEEQPELYTPIEPIPPKRQRPKSVGFFLNLLKPTKEPTEKPVKIRVLRKPKQSPTSEDNQTPSPGLTSTIKEIKNIRAVPVQPPIAPPRSINKKSTPVAVHEEKVVVNSVHVESEDENDTWKLLAKHRNATRGMTTLPQTVGQELPTLEVDSDEEDSDLVTQTKTMRQMTIIQHHKQEAEA